MNPAPHTKVFIVEDLPAMRERLSELVLELGSVEVVGDAGTPVDAIDGILRTHPDVLLLDYHLDRGTGLDVLRAIHPQVPEIVFVVLTNHAHAQYRRACLDAGARYFFDKSNELGEMRDIVAHGASAGDYDASNG